MQADYLIVGQGICGTFLSYYLDKAGCDYRVVDQPRSASPSRLAAGVINPVTGRRMVTAWIAEQLLPFAWDAYTELGNTLGIKAISQRNIIDFFPNPFMRENFGQRVAEGNSFLSAEPEEVDFNTYFHFEFGYGSIRPAYTAHLENIIPAWREQLRQKGRLIEAELQPEQLTVHADQVAWYPAEGQPIRAGKLIFCDGPQGGQNPYFSKLPYAANKGEALVVEIPGLPAGHIYKKSMALVPLETKDLFWIGSNYLWDFADEKPSEQFYRDTEALLKQWLKIPFRIVGHRAGLRPATLERRPFAGLHPHYPAIGILNGMGTKGCSLAPFFARQLAGHLLEGEAIRPDADVNRFQKILRPAGQ